MATNPKLSIQVLQQELSRLKEQQDQAMGMAVSVCVPEEAREYEKRRKRIAELLEQISRAT